MSKSNRRMIAIVIIVVIAIAAATGGYWYFQSQKQKPKVNIIIASTTSLHDTGLLDILGPKFEALYPQYNVSFISAGTGIAIQYAKNGDASAILVHAPSNEKQFLADGYGLDRKIIAYNFFVIVGTADDPAGINGTATLDAFKKIAAAGEEGKAVFVSRGDGSGTHIKEQSLWKAAGFNATKLREKSWYLEAGTGMGGTLNLATEKRAYTLADTATYLDYYNKKLTDLVILVSSGYDLLNVYSIISVNPEKITSVSNNTKSVNFEGAIDFTEWLVSDQGQAQFAEFGNSTVGHPLFNPAVKLLKEDPNSQMAQWIVKYAYINGTECPTAYQDNHPELYK